MKKLFKHIVYHLKNIEFQLFFWLPRSYIEITFVWYKMIWDYPLESLKWILEYNALFIIFSDLEIFTQEPKRLLNLRTSDVSKYCYFREREREKLKYCEFVNTHSVSSHVNS